jgi:tetratricopeptide (TPR) repeat protein
VPPTAKDGKQSPSPVKAEALVHRAHTFAGQGQWQKAAAEYAKAAPSFQQDLGFYCEYASALALAGNRAGYRRVRAEVLQRFAKATNPDSLYMLSRIASLAADDTADTAQAVKLAEQAVKALPGGWYRHTLAVAHYRAGQFERAVDKCQESMRDDPAWPGHVVDWLLLSLTHQCLGHAAEARQWLNKSEQWMEQVGKGLPKDSPYLWPVPSWGDRLEIQLLRREADALLNTKEQGKKAKD